MSSHTQRGRLWQFWRWAATFETEVVWRIWPDGYCEPLGELPTGAAKDLASLYRSEGRLVTVEDGIPTSLEALLH